MHTPRVVMVHGFTQAGAVWSDLVRELGERYEVVTPDLPGHGGSPASLDACGPWEAAERLGGVGGEAIYVGYSLGGRIALHLALARPELVRGLVVVGVRAGYEDPEEAAKRRASDETLARRLVDGGQDGLDAFLDDWLDRDFNERVPARAQHREIRRRNRVEGLAASLRACGSGAQDSLWSRLAHVDAPMLVMVGSEDQMRMEECRRIAEAVGSNADYREVEGAGHAVPFEKPQEFLHAVVDFVEQRIGH